MFAVVITEKGGAQRRMEFDKSEVTIGRVQGNDIILPKGNVSKRHSRIVLKDSRFIVVDLKSTNGTYVNGRKITSPLVVKPGDKVYIGDFILTVEDLGAAAYPDAAAAPPRPGPPPLRSSPPPAPSAPSPAVPVPSAPSAPAPIGPPPSSGGPPPLQPSAPAPQPAAPPPSAPQPAPAPVQVAPAPAPAPQPQVAPPEDQFQLDREPEPPTRAPRPSVGTPASSPAPAQAKPAPPIAPGPTGLPAVMGALKSAFPGLEDGSALGVEDGTRHALAKKAIAEVMRELGSSGAVDANDSSLAAAALREAVGYGAFEALLGDSSIQEIVVEGPAKVLVDRGAGLVPSEANFSSAAMLTVIARRLCSRGPTSPRGAMLQGVLPQGGQVSAMLPPIAVGGPIVEIRRAGGPSIDAFVARGVLSSEGAQVLRAAVANGKTIAVVGPQGAEVSELVASLAGLVDPGDRVAAVSRGATATLDLPHVMHLSGGTNGVSVGQVALQAARMRVDHLYVDGVSDASAFDVLAALASHGGGGFLGANTAPSQDPGFPLVFLATLSGHSPETAATLVARAVQVIVHLSKSPDGPKVTGIAEVTGSQGAQVLANPVA